jgi:hypothetical protein
MSYDKFPDRISRPMSRGQAATLRTLSVEAYQPKMFEENSTLSFRYLRAKMARSQRSSNPHPI